MKAIDIQRKLIRDRWQQSFVLPNLYAHDWWECDVFELTKAGYFREYEVKVSRADFFADAKKAREQWDRLQRWEPWTKPVIENKHALLAARSTRAPAQFWFCTPKGLVTLDEVPEWAGLIEFEERHGEDFRSGDAVTYFMVNEAKKAPRLHNEKFGDRAKGLLNICYWRMHDAMKTTQPAFLTSEPDQFENGAGI